MKNLSLPIFLLLCFFASGQTYNPSGPGGTPLNRPIALTGKPDGARTVLYDGIHFTYRAFVSVAEANSYILGTARLGWFPVAINTGGTLLNGVITGGTNALYFWRDGIADANLIPMNGGGSTNTSIGGGVKIAVDGTNNIKSVTTDILTFITVDSSSGTIRFVIDTAGLVSYLRIHHPFILKVPSDSGLVVSGPNSDTLRFNYLMSYLVSQDSIGGGNLYSKIHGNWVLVGSVGSGGGTTNIYNTRAAMLAVRPSNATGAVTLGCVAAGDYGGANYVYNSASTATDDGMTVLTPTIGSGVGRYLLIPNGRASLKQLNIFPSTDNTAQINAAMVVAANNFKLIVNRSSNYFVDPNVGGLLPKSYLSIEGEDSSSSQISAKTYSSTGKFLVLYNDTVTKVKHFSIDKVKFTYRQTWNGTGGFGGANPIGDTDSHIINITGGQFISVTNCILQDGGTNSALIFYAVDTGYVKNNKFYNIGNIAFSTSYSQTNNNFWIENNSFDNFGMYTKYNTSVGNFQNGNDALELGGTAIHVRNNVIRNGADRLWFSMETKLWGYNNDVIGNTFDGAGRNSLGLSYANSEYNPLNLMYNPVISGNTDINMGYHVHKARDTLAGTALYFASNLMEHSGIDGLQSYGNRWQGMHYILSRRMSNSSFNDFFDNTGSVATFESAEDILFQLGTGGTDTVRNTTISGTYIGKDGELLRTYISGEVIQGVNMNLTANWTGTHIIGELYPATGAVVPTGININNGTYNGTIGSAFYTQTATPITFSFANNVAKNLDSASNFLTILSGAAPIINKENTRFSSGLFSSHIDSVSVSGTNLVTWKNGQAKTSVALPSGGSANLDSSRTAQKVTIVSSGGTNAIVDSAQATTTIRTGLSGTFTAYQAQRLLGKPRVFNVVTDYGAKGDSVTDDSGPIQAAINAAKAAGGGVVYFPNGYYSAKNSIISTVGGNPCNCQLYIPYSPSDTAMVIILQGETPGDFEFQGVTGFPAPKKGVIIESSLTSVTAGDALLAEVKGPGSGTFTKTNHTDPSIINITFRTKTTSGANALTALNLKYASKVKLDFVKADINQSLADSPDPTGIGSYGIILPEKSNHASVDVGTIRVGGFDIGMQIGEHAVVKDFQNACNNVGLATISSDHSSSIQTFEGELNKTNIRYDGDLNLAILNYNTEQYDGSLGSKWYNFVEDVHFSSYTPYAAVPTTLTIGSSSVGVSGTAGEYIRFLTNDSARVNMLSRNHMSLKTGVFNRGDTAFKNYIGTFSGDGTTPIRIMNNNSAPSGKRKWLEYTDGFGYHYFSRLADNGLTAVNHLTFTGDVNATLSDTLIAEKGIHGTAGELNLLDLTNMHNGVSLSGTPTSTNDVNVIKGTSNSTTIGLIASSTAAFNTVNGPFIAFRGNTYSAASTQRGNVYLYAGSPTTPVTGEGIVDIGTAAGSAISITPANVIKLKTNTPSVGDVWTATNADGSGHWATGGGGSTSPGGSNTQIQFNNSGAFGGLSGVTTPDGTNTLSINTLQLPGSGSGIGTKIYNNATNPTAALTSIYPASGTNINTSLYVIPKGTGASGDKSDLILFGTDFVADASNFDYSNWRATGSSFDFYSGAAGTGTVRPINIYTGSNTSQLQLKINGGLKLGQYGAGTFTGTVAKDLAVTSSGDVIESTPGAIFTSGTVSGIKHLTTFPWIIIHGSDSTIGQATPGEIVAAANAYTDSAIGRTSNHSLTYTTANDAHRHLYRVNPHTVITTGTGAGDSRVKTTLSYTDGFGNTITTIPMIQPGQTSAEGTPAQVAGSSYFPSVVISIAPNTTITIAWNTSGTFGMTWSEFLTIEKIQ